MLTLDLALIRWSVVCRTWHEGAAGSAPQLGPFLAGWFQRDMGMQIPEEIPTNRESFRVGWREADDEIAIRARQQSSVT